MKPLVIDDQLHLFRGLAVTVITLTAIGLILFAMRSSTKTTVYTVIIYTAMFAVVPVVVSFGRPVLELVVGTKLRSAISILCLVQFLSLGLPWLLMEQNSMQGYVSAASKFGFVLVAPALIALITLLTARLRRALKV